MYGGLKLVFEIPDSEGYAFEIEEIRMPLSGEGKCRVFVHVQGNRMIGATGKGKTLTAALKDVARRTRKMDINLLLRNRRGEAA